MRAGVGFRPGSKFRAMLSRAFWSASGSLSIAVTLSTRRARPPQWRGLPSPVPTSITRLPATSIACSNSRHSRVVCMMPGTEPHRRLDHDDDFGIRDVRIRDSRFRRGRRTPGIVNRPMFGDVPRRRDGDAPDRDRGQRRLAAPRPVFVVDVDRREADQARPERGRECRPRRRRAATAGGRTRASRRPRAGRGWRAARSRRARRRAAPAVRRSRDRPDVAQVERGVASQRCL